MHYGRPRLFAPPDRDNALLLGDYLYAHGLVRVAGAPRGRRRLRPGRADLALCAAPRRRASTATAPPGPRAPRCSASGRLGPAREALRLRGDAAPLLALAREAAGEEAVDRALAAHRVRVG